jgi:quinoprotein glucose dehydrogenase
VVGGPAAVAGCLSDGAGPEDEPDTDDAQTTATGEGATRTTASGTDAPTIETETVATGFTHPWAVEFLPDDPRLLVTERDGGLNLVGRDGGVETVGGTPEVHVTGQGGLLDVALHPDFPEPPWVYLTYSATDGAGASATHLGRGRLDRDAMQLADFEQLHVAEPFVESGAHYGSRVVFGPDRRCYVTVGDRQFKNFGPDHTAQDLTTELGTTLRLEPDGAIPDDNPFVDDPDARDAIFSYGHRNGQGLTVHPETGAVWETEYGEKDGDEINVLQRGGNYGWPVADNSCEYGTDEPVGVSHADREGVVSPVYGWPCGSGGFPPGGMTFYDGAAFPEWRGDLLVAGLAAKRIGHFAVDGRSVEMVGSLLADRGSRIRDVETASDTGHLYVAVDAGDAPILRITRD